MLETSDYILAEDTRHTIKLLNHYDIKTKKMAYHKFNENKKTFEIIDMMKEQDINVALVTDAGTPCISDPGYIIVKAAHENNIEVIGIPGASAVITGLSIAGFDTQSFSFFGFVPRENKEIKEFYKKIRNSNTCVSVVYESPKRIIKSLYKMKEELGTVNIAVMSDMTKIHEKVYRGNIDDVIDILGANDNADKGEYAIAIENSFESYDNNNAINNNDTLYYGNKKMVKNGKLTSYGKKILDTHIEKRDTFSCVEIPAKMTIKTFDGILVKSCSGLIHFHYLKNYNDWLQVTYSDIRPEIYYHFHYGFLL